MIEIRPAQAGDDLQAAPMILEFYSELVERVGLAFNGESARKLMRYFVGDPGERLPGAIAHVAVKDGLIIGFIAGILGPWMMAQEVKVYEEIAWFVTARERGTKAGLMLYHAAEKAAKEAGASFMNMVAETAGSPAVGAFYERKGYREIERKWMKKL